MNNITACVLKIKVFKETFHTPSNETDVNMIGIIRQKAKGMSLHNLVTKKLVNICSL